MKPADWALEYTFEQNQKQQTPHARSAPFRDGHSPEDKPVRRFCLWWRRKSTEWVVEGEVNARQNNARER